MLSTTAQFSAEAPEPQVSQESDHYPATLTHTETTPTGNFFSVKKKVCNTGVAQNNYLQRYNPV